ncbi:hypothetical protein EDD76_105100 [Kineothrix alysoides]|uniref:Uncharacterized protein n=1 Tax=Kineothrix alysoides TaxID=1469948 RepID=A0A4R1R0X6_9FIRM|nr:hypothetical protein [Kineothrix alysoides]TCL58928.1 hypothetical protein EDD76_105100 [Kineothrix alysoides]
MVREKMLHKVQMTDGKRNIIRQQLKSMILSQTKTFRIYLRICLTARLKS